jgi:hypothetical protein
MDANESESEGSQHSLDEDLALEVLASSSSSKFKHQYPDDPVFVHDEDCEKDDDISNPLTKVVDRARSCQFRK